MQVIIDPGHFLEEDMAMQETPFWVSRPQEEPPGRRERKKLETRRRIYRAAMALFAEKGFDATTVDEIAERADVAKGTVFNYFPHKKAFLHTSYHIWFRGMMEEMGPVETWPGDARARFMNVLDHMADVSLQHRALSRLIIFENMRQAHQLLDRPAPGSADGAVGDPGQEGIRLMEGLAREVIRQGKIHAEIRSEVDEDHAAALIAGMAFNTLVRWLVQGGSPQEMKAALATKLDIIFTGLAPGV
jgi:AcrR family transcriptional regulator